MRKHNEVSKHSHDKEEKVKIGISKKKVIAIIAVLLVLIAIIGIIVFTQNESNEEITSIPIINNILPTGKDKTNLKKDEDIVDIEMEDTLGRYNVLGVLKIDKLDLEKEILDETTDESLNLSVTKFYGPDLNKIGNFCITGHNYKSIFGYLDNLELGDTFDIIDKAESQKVTYKIYDKYIVNTDELDCLSQETEGKKEVTLITCTPGGITRLIIKAKEI